MHSAPGVDNLNVCMCIHMCACLCTKSFLLAHYVQYISSILAGLRVRVLTVCYASDVPGNQLPIVGDKTCSDCNVLYCDEC